MNLSYFIGYFPNLWAALVSLFFGHVWLLVLIITLGLTFTLDFIQRKVLGFITRRLRADKQPILSAIFYSVIPPLSFFIWLTGSVMALTTLMYQFNLMLDLIPYIVSIKQTVSIVSVAWFGIRFTKRVEAHLKQLEHVPDSVWDSVSIEALAKVLKLTIFTITGLIVLASFGVNLTGLIAFGGMGGIAVGFAAKDVLGNVFGGMMIYMDKPFKVGEWIRSPDKEIEGTVERIGWRMTVIRTFDKRPLYVPNGTFSTISIENPSRMTNRRIREVIGVRYTDINRVKPIAERIREMLLSHEGIDNEQTLIVNFLEFAASSLNIMVYTFTKTTNWIEFHHIKQDVLLNIAKIIEEEGAEIAFPTRTLHLGAPEELTEAFSNAKS